MSGRSFEVLLGEQIVGLLSEDDDKRVVFRFSDAYRRDPKRAVLSQSCEDDLGRAYAGKRPGMLPAFFSNLLPEGRFREVLETSLGVCSGDDLGLLAAACDDLPGAVVLRPTQEALTLGVDTLQEVVQETLTRLLEAWRRSSATWPLLPDHRRALADHWRRVPLLHDAGDLSPD